MRREGEGREVRRKMKGGWEREARKVMGGEGRRGRGGKGGGRKGGRDKERRRKRDERKKDDHEDES